MDSIKFEEIEINDFTLEARGDDNGVFWFESKALSTDFECEEGLKRLARDSINKHLVWRHAHPLQTEHKIAHIFGTIVNSYVKNGFIICRYECYSHTEDHLEFIDIIKRKLEIGDPLGVSMHYRKYFDTKLEKVIHYDVFEHSVTPYPKCEDCNNLKYGVSKMEKNEKEQEGQESKDSANEELDEKMKKIKELEDSLNAKTNILEEMKTKVEKLESDLKAKADALEEKKEKEMTLEDKVNELRKEVDYFKKKPTLDKILEVKPNIDKRYFDWLKVQDENYINKSLEDIVNDAAKPAVESTEESAEKIKKDIEKREDNVNESDIIDKFISQLPKQEREKFKEFKKNK